MARTSKTRIGAEQGERARAMREAAATGSAAVQRAHESKIASEQAGQEQITRTGMQAGQLYEEGARRQEQAKQAEADREVRSRIAEGEFNLAERESRIRAADAGIEGVEKLQNPLEQRKQKLQAEMDQGNPPAAPGGAGPGPLPSEDAQRLQQQTGKDLEYTGRGGYQSTQGPGGIRRSGERTQREAREARLLEQKIELNDLKLAEGGMKYQEAQAKGNDQERLAALKSMSDSIDESQELINKLMSGEITPEAIAETYSDNPSFEGGQVDKKRAAQFLRTRLGQQQVSFMAASGQLPPGYDPDNPVIKKFNENYQNVAASFRSLGQLASTGLGAQGSAFQQASQEYGQGEQGSAIQQSWQGIRTIQERNEFLRQTTAQIMLEAERYRAQQQFLMKAGGFQEQLSQRDQKIAQQQQFIQQLQEQVQLLGGGGEQRPETEMRQGMNEQGEPVTEPVRVKKFGPQDEQRVKEMQGGNQPEHQFRNPRR